MIGYLLTNAALVLSTTLIAVGLGIAFSSEPPEDSPYG